MNSKGNIVFLGMMGSGKSSIGKIISKRLRVDFFDIDTLVEKELKMKISKNLEPIVSGLAAAIVIGVLAFLTLRTSAGIWLMFSFGATVFLVFVLYNLDTAQPKNIFFGHLVSVIVGIVFNETIGFSFYSLGLSVGVAVALMVYLKVMHPPAASNPLVVLFTDVSFDFILFPVITGTILIILMSFFINKIILKRNYPTKWF